MQKQEKRKRYKEKGITLVALVITVVILIILASITLSFTLGENGIISKAQKAAQLTEEASANEEMGLYLTDIKLSQIDNGNFRLADYLSSNIGKNGLEDFSNNGDGYGQVSYKGHNFLVNLEDYTYTYQGESDGTVNRLLKQVLGNNNEDVPGISMVEAGEIETEDLGWKVLSVNEDGSVNLIANRNTGFEVSLSGINGYTNGVKALNEICAKLYGGLKVNGEKVISARSVNVEDFYNITYREGKEYTTQKIQPYINTLDVANDEYSSDQIESYIDPSNTSGTQASNTQMLLTGTGMTIRVENSRPAKETTSMMNTGNNYWLATRYTNSTYDSKNNTVPDSEDVRYEQYGIRYIRADGAYAGYEIFRVNNHEQKGSNSTYNCALRPVITVPGSCVPNKTVGTSVETEAFHKGESGEAANGYVKANSIEELLGVNVAGVIKVESGLPTAELDMTWTKLEKGGYDSLTGEFDTGNYDYYIADRTTKLQIRLTGAPAYNNGVLAMDTVINNLYGNLTEIKLSDGSTKKVKVVLARNAKFEDFYEDKGVSGTYGGIWSTNASDSTAQEQITSTQNRYAPTLFAYEDVDASNGISDGYSDAKIDKYNLSTTGIKEYLTEDKRNSYSYEYYNADPGLKVIYNALWGTRPNRNEEQAQTGTEFWLSSRCVGADWYSARFYFRYMAGSGSFSASNVFDSNGGANSRSRGLRPVLQVSQ